MSYILDALRKADAQRARDPSRGIHAQAAPAAMSASVGGRRNYWAAGTVAALLVLAAGWLLFSPAPVAAPPAAIAPAPAPVARIEAPAAPQPPPPANEVRPPAPEPVVAAAPRPVPMAAASAAVPVAKPAAVPVSAAPAPERTYSMAELPADVVQAMPKFSVNGGVYSENVAQRMLIVNGQVFNEGSEIAAGVVLEQIRPRVALIKFRGLRIAQPY